jgi:hypothetical protein
MAMAKSGGAATGGTKTRGAAAAGAACGVAGSAAGGPAAVEQATKTTIAASAAIDFKNGMFARMPAS